LPEDGSGEKISMKILYVFSGDNEPTAGKMPYLALSKTPLKLPMDADDLQNSISSSSSTDKPLMKLS